MGALDVSKRKTIYSVMFLILPVLGILLVARTGVSPVNAASSVAERFSTPSESFYNVLDYHSQGDGSAVIPRNAPLSMTRNCNSPSRHCEELRQGRGDAAISDRRSFEEKMKTMKELRPGFLYGLSPNFYDQFHNESLMNVPPEYPRIARQLGYEGKVEVDVSLDFQGKVLETRMVRSSGYAILDEAALRAVKSWHFQAPGKSNSDESTQVRVPVIFTLD